MYRKQKKLWNIYVYISFYNSSIVLNFCILENRYSTLQMGVTFSLFELECSYLCESGDKLVLFNLLAQWC